MRYYRAPVQFGSRTPAHEKYYTDAFMWRLSLALVVLTSASSQQLRLSPASSPAIIAKYFAPETMIVAIPEAPIGQADSIRLELRPNDFNAVFPVRLLGIFDGCAWAVLPEDAPLGPATVTLMTPSGNESSDVLIQASAVGIFTREQEAALRVSAEQMPARSQPALEKVRKAG